ncbi:MAG TPA: alpha/beta hydrolase, partial [bacterium]|nr:alpha/beta hydrolase [bacterium]
DVDGVPAHYIEAGEGETLVLIHGALAWCCAELTYGAVIGSLARSFHVVAVDVVGFGLTPGRGPQDFSAQAQGDFLVKFLQRLGRPVHLAGNSHGGWLVQYVAHTAPDLAQRLIIINSLNGTSPVPARYALPRDTDAPPTTNGVAAYLRDFYLRQDLVTDERVRRTHDVWMRNFDFARSRRAALGATPAAWNRNLLYRGVHISAHAAALRKPVLLTWSRENTGASPADAAAFLERLSDGELYVLTGAKHHVQTEHPERWTAAVTQFLQSTRETLA